MKFLFSLLLLFGSSTLFSQIDLIGEYTCKRGEVSWNLDIRSDSTFDLKITVPEGNEGVAGTWKQDGKKLLLFYSGEDAPDTIYKVKFKGDVQFLKSKKLFGSRIFLQRKYKLEKK